MNRVFRDVALMSLVCALIGCGIVLTVFAMHWFLGEPSPVDRGHDMERLPGQLVIAAIAGTIVGLFAGLASRVPPAGFPLLRSCLWIALAAAVTRLFTAPFPKATEADQYYASYIATVAAGLITTIALIWLGYRRHSTSAGGASTP